MSEKKGSVAPKERINIKYTTETNGQIAEKELPFHILVTGDFTGKIQPTSIEDRTPISIEKNTFDSVMANAGIELEFSVPNHLSDDNVESEIPIKLEIETLKDLSPDKIAQAVPELKKLIELRESLVSLKGPLGNKPAFRAQIESIINDSNSRQQLLKELNMITENDD